MFDQLLDRHFAAKLSDLAFPSGSRRAGRPRGTLHWMAPECLRGSSNKKTRLTSV